MGKVKKHARSDEHFSLALKLGQAQPWQRFQNSLSYRITANVGTQETELRSVPLALVLPNR